MHIQTNQRVQLFTVCCFLLLFSFSFTEKATALEVPPLKSRVNDLGNIISQSTETQLENSLRNLERVDSTQIVVLTIPSLEGENLEQFSLKVAETWKLGQSDFDNGALLLVAVGERKVRIEVGYGLEGSLTDLLSGRIIKNNILPHFKQGNFDQGIVDGVNAMYQGVKGEYSEQNNSSTQQKNDPLSLLGLLAFFFFFIGNLLQKHKIASVLVSGIGAPILGVILLGFSLTLVVILFFVGIAAGFIFSTLNMHGGSGRSTPYLLGGSSTSSGGFGGFGGFSGGGGGFGGGGASGGW